MRIMLWSNAPWANTGYGTQTRGMVRAFRKLGHEVAVTSLYGLLGSSLTWQGVQVYPAHNEPLAYDVVGAYAKDFKADIIISLYDIWAFPSDVKKYLPVPWVPIIPVDGAPVPEPAARRAKTAEYPVAMSQFGAEMLGHAGVNVDYIPLAIDTNVYKPGNKAKAREQLGIPLDMFFCIMVAANKGYPARKSFPEVLRAFSRFSQKHTDSFLYLHTNAKPLGTRVEGIFFDELIKECEINHKQISIVDQHALRIGVDDAQMALLYQAADVLLNPAMGEGFGLTVAEAQACGCPVITQNVTAMSELTVNGIAIEPLQKMWWPHLGYNWFIPSVDRIYNALEQIYAWSPTRRYENAKDGIAFMQNFYSWDAVIANHWQPFFEKVERELW